MTGAAIAGYDWCCSGSMGVGAGAGAGEAGIANGSNDAADAVEARVGGGAT